MQPTVIATIISVLGATTLGLFIYFIRSVSAKLDKLNEKVGSLTAGIAAIAATQAEHGSKLERMMGHGERISALEGATFGTAAT